MGAAAECESCTGTVGKSAPVGYVPALVRSHDRWGQEYGGRATAADWAAIVAGMTDVQKLVHLAGRMTPIDEAEFANRLFNESRETYREGLAQEATRLGCEGAATAPVAGPELSALRQRADWAASSVTHTYNLQLAREIIKIGEEVPRANRHVYAKRLFYGKSAWDKKYWADKAVQIAEVETMMAVNAAVADFYARNGDIAEAEGNARPFGAVCARCLELVAGNPYRSVDEAYLAWDRLGLPHVGCPHFIEAAPARRLTQAECAELWVGV